MSAIARPAGSPPLDGGSRSAGGQRLRDKITLVELCEELQISRSTFYDWRAKGRAPRCIKLPNGDLRIRRSDLDRWLEDRQESAV